ncbi:uncharacterized protein NMK_1163 [Novimethylophilus kurashikiensis]|uniref:DUF475 domain-containing protein n=1 Tax=Novimethylophilus kurashikiensis TaxID=1825523 RepID=A0A2R5F5K3_9PROT|nr:DUF475 domain-containing protein [Novimethylophilus kurashikiensis]GBG13612.1 uncharacterized protein NMK_1163 [Novimethylophilus kurashikiensis]
MLKHYFSSIMVTVLAVAAGFWIDGPAGAWMVLVLGVLEISLSFDNAVVNASILQHWSPLWQARFIRYGLPVAVFGMRFAFPLIIVAILADIDPVEAFTLALHQPDAYARILTASHHQIAAYGGAFLFMAFFKYFLDKEKNVHWIEFIERRLSLLGKLEAIQVVLVLLILIAAAGDLPAADRYAFMLSGLAGLITYVLADALGTLVDGDAAGKGGRMVKEGVMGLLYLELLDASFSFDGVIGAFAVTNNILIITLGLGIGAMFVRSITLHLVETGKLAEYRFLEHSAFWAIGALAALTISGVHWDIPDGVAGLLGGLLIGLGLLSSMAANKRDAKAAMAKGV